MVLVVGEDCRLVTRECPPGYVLTEEVLHVEPQGRLQSANFSCTDGKTGHETSPGDNDRREQSGPSQLGG